MGRSSLKHRLAIALAGRPVQTALRNFPWPIRRRILDAPPIRPKGGVRLLILTTPKTWLDCLWSAYSWSYFAGDEFSPNILVDGTVSQKMREQCARILPGVPISDAAADDAATIALPSVLKQYRRQHPYGRKLCAIIHASGQDSLMYSDADILIFKRPTELIENIKSDRISALYNKSAGGHAWNAQKIVELMHEQGIHPLDGFNSGLLFIPKQSLDVDLCIQCVSRYVEDFSAERFIDQSTLNALFSRIGARSLDQGKYSIAETGMYFWQTDGIDYRQVVARHYVGVVRHRMYINGMSVLAEKIFGDHKSSA